MVKAFEQTQTKDNLDFKTRTRAAQLIFDYFLGPQNLKSLLSSQGLSASDQWRYQDKQQ